MTSKHFRSSTMLSPRGNIFFALFGAVALVGILGASVMNFMKGPLATSVKLTKMNTAENQMAIGAQVAVMASANQANSGDCDSDTYVEPLPWRAATTEPKPTNGGLIPLNLGMSKKDPWGTEYGYCAWNHGGTTTGGGCTANMLAGTNSNIYPVVAIVSAGPDKTFTTTCRTFAAADANTDGDLLDAGDSDLVSKAATSDDDIIFTYTYQEATGASGGLWSIKAGVPTTATIDKDIEVQGNAVFTGAGNFGGGLLLPDKTLINCNDIVNAGVMAKNGNTIEICDGAGTWTAIGGGGGSIDSLTDGVTSYGTDDNIFMGQNAGNGIVAGADRNLAIGVGAFSATKTLAADNNIALGFNTLLAATTGSNNIAIGMGAADVLTTGNGNVAIGNGTMGWGGSTNPTGNVVIGSNASAQANMSNMAENVAIGNFSFYQAGASASNNVAVGSNSLRDIKASSNVAVGHSAMRDAGAGTGGTAIGFEAMRYANSSTTAYTSANTAVGHQALRGSTTASANIGTGNTAVGYQSLIAVTSGSNNVAIGDRAADNLTTGSNNITIGQNIDAVSATGSNQLNIGNTIYGDISLGNVGIGTTSPTAKLEVTGNINTFGPSRSINFNSSDNAGSVTDGLIRIYRGSNSSLQGQFGYVGGTPFSDRYDFSINLSGSEHFRVKNNGNVGIGTPSPAVSLDVSGKTDAIRPAVGTTAQRPTCDSTRAGVFRWNTTTSVMEWCTGSSWVTPTVSTSGGGASCPGGYTLNAGRCYKFVNAGGVNIISYAAARANCQADGADLATANDATEYNYLNTFTGANDVWLGYTDAATEGTWVWNDTSSSYTNWASGEPNGGTGENCAFLNEWSGKIIDITCSANNLVNSHVCERAP